MYSFSEKLARTAQGIRQERGITYRELGGMSGYSLEHVARVLNRKSNGSMRMLERLARSLGYTVEDIVIESIYRNQKRSGS